MAINENDKDLAKLRDQLAESFRNKSRDKAVKAAIRKRIDNRKDAAPLHKAAGAALKKEKAKEKANKKKKSVGEKINQKNEGLSKVMQEIRKQNKGG